MAGAAAVLLFAIILFRKADGDSAQGTRLVDERDFKVADITEVAKVFIADRNGFTTKLEKQADGTWLLDDQYEAYDNAMKNLLDAIENIEMQFIPANKSVPAIVSNLASEGIHVELFDRSGDKIKGYYIGGSTQDERGTYAIMEGAERPYVIHIPNWTGNVRFRYSLIDQEWRTKKLFATPMEEIQLVSVEYPTRRNRSFVLQRQGERWMIGPFYETDQPAKEVPRGRAEQYLVNFEEAYLSAHLNRNTEAQADALRKLPYAVLRMVRTDGSEKDVKFFPRLDERYESLDPNTDAFASALGEKGFYLLMNEDKDFGAAQTGSMSKLLLTYQNF